MECKKCNSDIQTQNCIKCVVCKDRFHYGCVGMSELNFKKLGKARQMTWRCLGCKSGKGKDDKKESETDLFKERMSLLNDLEDNSDDIDGDLEMKESIKSDTLTEEETNESKGKIKAEGEAATAGNESSAYLSSASATATERRSNRIMTRKQRDSELRLQFAKKLKTTPQQRPKQALPNSPRRFSKSDLNTSDSETYSSPRLPKKTSTGSGMTKKLPLPLGNKRKSSLEYAKNRKLMRKGDEGVGDTTTTDDNDEDTEESYHKHNNKTVKRKVINNAKKKKVETTDDDDDDEDDDEDEDEEEDEDEDDEEDESGSETETDLEEELKKAISKKFTSYKNSPDSPAVKKANPFSTGGALKKKPVPRPNLNKAVTKNKQVTITATRVITKTMDKQYKNETVSNVSNTKLLGNHTKKIDSIKIYYPNIEKRTDNVRSGNKMVPASKRVNNVNTGNTVKVAAKPDECTPSEASPKAKSEFDKLVDELFETETTREKLSEKTPEIMLIDNEPTDVYTLNIDDTLEEDSDLEALMEEVYEDETVDVTTNMTGAAGNGTLPSLNSTDVTHNTTQGSTSAHTNTESGGHKPKILNVNSPLISPKTVTKTQQQRQQEVALKKSNRTNPVPSRSVHNNEAVNKSAGMKQISRLGAQVSLTPVVKTPSSSTMKQSITSDKRTPNHSEKRVTNGIDYKEKYNKLHTSYEMLSKKIAQYMEKTKQEKDQLKRQLKLERSKLEKAQQDIEILKKKFEYLMKNKPSTGNSKRKV
ncbi:hypothetical protein WDU94_005727 [Cyamophila willieti]